MTIIPKPFQKPLRICEIIFGLVCVVAGVWAFILLFNWLTTGKGSVWEVALLFAQSLYLLGFGGNLLRCGYLSMVLWLIALGILCALPVTAVKIG